MSIASFNDKPARLSIALPMLSALAGALVTWGAIIWQLHSDEQQMRVDGTNAAIVNAAAHAEHLDELIDQADQLLITIKHMRKNGGSLKQIERLMEDLPRHAWMPIYIDADGVVRGSVTASTRGINVADKSFFRVHQHDPAEDMVIHAPGPGFGAMAGKTVIRLTRRVNEADGRFGGVAALAIPAQVLTQFSGVSAAQATALVVIGLRDGTVLTNSASVGAVHEALVTDPFSEVLARATSLAAARELIEREGNFFEASAQLIHHPLDVVLALDKRVVLEPLVMERWRLLTLGGIVTLILVAIVGWTIWRQIVRKHEEERVRHVREVFRRAVDDSKDEFYMLSPLRSRNDALSDFCIEDCNSQAAKGFLLPREALLGQPVSSLLRPVVWRATCDYLARAMTEGFAEMEACLYRSGSSEKRWMYCRATLVADGLAVTLRDITNAKKNEHQLQQLALTDGLTGLPNRHWVNQQLSSVLKQAAQAQEYVAALFIDLDNFKTINDTLGHQAGDEYLRAAAKVLQHVVRKDDIVVRLGGDEFLVLILHLDDVQKIHKAAKGIVERMRELGQGGRWSSANPRASVGVATFPMDARTADDLVQAADIAMYEAKRLGKDRYEIFVPSLRERLRDEFGLESALRRAVADGGLGVMFQPRASALTGRLQGFEALARWEHPVLGQIPPARFIPMAEKHDLIDDIGCWVVEEVCRTLVQWRSSDKLLHPVSINISAKQLKTPRLRNHLIDCMRRYQIPAAQIELELTESTMIGNDPVIRRELKLLSEMGHKLMIDDFGTGYSSLAQLQHLRVDVLKIDASFVRNLSTGDEARLICRAMVQIGKTLGIDVVAEGVETRQQLEQLQRFGCDEVQGYLLAEPMRSDEAMALLDQRALFSVEAPALLPADIPPPTRMGGASTS